MDDENGRKPSRVAFMLLISGYLLFLIGFLMSFFSFLSAMATGERISTTYEIYILSFFYFGLTSVMGSQIWYLILKMEFFLGEEKDKSQTKALREPSFLIILSLVLLGYLLLFSDLVYDTYDELAIVLSLSPVMFVFLFGVPLYIGCFYLFVIRPQGDESAEVHSE